MTKIYCYPRCTTCQKATKFLDTKSVEYELINIKENNPDKETLRSLWQKSGLELKKFFNTSGILYREMELSKKIGNNERRRKTRFTQHRRNACKTPDFDYRKYCSRGV